MERLYIGVGNLFIIGQSHQIVGGHAVKIRQRRNRKWADVLVVIGFVFPQRRFRQAGLLRQLFQRQVLYKKSTVSRSCVPRTMESSTNSSFFPSISSGTGICFMRATLLRTC